MCNYLAKTGMLVAANSKINVSNQLNRVSDVLIGSKL